MRARFPKVDKWANQPRRRPVSRLFFEMALTRPDGSDCALHFPSDLGAFHSGIEECPQFIVIRAGPGAAGWSRTSHFPFAFCPLFWQSGFFAPTSRSFFA
jgi:hypothetical protein